MQPSLLPRLLPLLRNRLMRPSPLTQRNRLMQPSLLLQRPLQRLQRLLLRLSLLNRPRSNIASPKGSRSFDRLFLLAENEEVFPDAARLSGRNQSMFSQPNPSSCVATTTSLPYWFTAFSNVACTQA